MSENCIKLMEKANSIQYVKNRIPDEDEMQGNSDEDDWILEKKRLNTIPAYPDIEFASFPTTRTVPRTSPAGMPTPLKSTSHLKKLKVIAGGGSTSTAAIPRKQPQPHKFQNLSRGPLTEQSTLRLPTLSHDTSRTKMPALRLNQTVTLDKSIKRKSLLNQGVASGVIISVKEYLPYNSSREGHHSLKEKFSHSRATLILWLRIEMLLQSRNSLNTLMPDHR
jgi:hypothetical protein